MAKSGFYQSLGMVLLFVAPTVSTLAMFLTHVGLRLELTASLVRVCVFCFSL